MKRRFLAIAAAALALLLAVVGTDIGMNRVFYNPYADYDAHSGAFSRCVQLLVPYAAYGWIAPYQPGTPRHFSRFSEEYFICTPTAMRDINDNRTVQGTLRFLFGKASADPPQNTLSEFLFTQGQITPGKKIKSTAGQNQSALVVVAFPKPISTQELLDGFSRIQKPEDGQKIRGELLRALVRTSGDDRDLVFGIACEGAALVPDQGGASKGASAKIREQHFMENLRYLKDHQREFSVLMESDLFGSATDLRLDERIAYLEKEGTQCIGAALFIRGDMLDQYLRESGAAIVSEKVDV